MNMHKKIFEKYTAMAVTDVGRVRGHNEDNVLIDEELGLLLVADGMGGHQAGEIASMEAIKIIQQMIHLQQRSIKKQSGFFRLFGKLKLNLDEYQSVLENALYEANHHIHRLNIDRNACDGWGMGTTVAGCWLIADDTMLVFHVGDSRVYRFRKQKLETLTKDHSVIQAWYDNGCEGEKPKSNVILRAVGPFSETQAEIQVVTIEEGDGFLICSDGLTDMLDDVTIENTLQGITAGQLGNYSQKLLQSALDQGGKDNVSIILFAR